MSRVWERISQLGQPGQRLSYWRMTLAHNVYLSVSRDRGEPGRWLWRLRGPEYGPGPGWRIHEEGASGTVAGAKRAAERAVLNPHCINCGTDLDTGTPDMFHCPGCGDEWSPDAWPYYQSD